MSEQMKAAVDLMEQLRQGIKSFDVSLINGDPNFIFLNALKERLINLRSSPNGFSIYGFSIEDIVNSVNVDISRSTEKEVAEYLGISFAEILHDMHKKLGSDFEFWSTVIKNLSVKFDM